MPTNKRERIDPTEDWGQLRLRLKWPEQLAYELVRPVVLWGETAGERAKETARTSAPSTARPTASMGKGCWACSRRVGERRSRTRVAYPLR